MLDMRQYHSHLSDGVTQPERRVHVALLTARKQRGVPAISRTPVVAAAESAVRCLAGEMQYR